jgi:hypothetical protein
VAAVISGDKLHVVCGLRISCFPNYPRQ